MTTLLLMPSPLVGEASWAPVAECLRDRGAAVAVVGTGAPGRPDEVVDAVLEAAAALRGVVLVPHSNAGLYAPHLGDLLDVRATVFVDAALPDEAPDTGLAPPGLLEMLRDLADEDGQLPPWTHWWDDLAGLFPDAATRAAVERGQPRLPLSYFTARLPVPRGWADRPCAYLAFGDTYAPETGFARDHGWPVRELAGGHLHALHDPDGVAGEVLGLAARLTG